MLNKILRFLITGLIITGIILGLIYLPIITSSVITTIILLFIFTDIPYNIIVRIFRKLRKAKYACIVHPFKNKYITVKEEGFTGEPSDRIVKHEQDHIKYFNERWTIIQCVIYLVFTVWYGYYNNPIEIRARKAEEL